MGGLERLELADEHVGVRAADVRQDGHHPDEEPVFVVKRRFDGAGFYPKR